MTIPIFDLPLEKRVLSMILGGINTTNDLAEECGVSYEEIEDLQRSIMFLAPQNRPGSRSNEGNHIEWNISEKGRIMSEINGIPVYPSPKNRENYFQYDEKKNKRFVPEWLAKDITKTVKIYTMFDNKDMYFYNGGSYKPGAEKIVSWYSRKLLGDLATRNRENEVVAHVSSVTQIDRSYFDSNINKINLINGVFDIERKNLMPHTHHDMMTIQLPVVYDRNAGCKVIENFVSEIVDEKDVPIVQEIFGYCLLRDYRFHKIFMMLGEGSNGKSTLLELLKRFLGPSNVSSIALQDLENKRFTLSGLYGKFANIYPDLSDISLKETGRMKSLCGGDSLSAEKKFKDFFNFMNYAKLIFSANRLPSSFDDSDAFFRRWLIIQFPNQFTDEDRDPNLISKLTTKDEISGCFNWAIDGLDRLVNNGCFSNEICVSSMRRLYRKLSSPIAAFSEAMLEEEEESFITKEELYAQFVQFCKREKVIAMTKPKFGKLFISDCGLRAYEGNAKIDKRNTRVWRNIKFIE